MIDLYHLHKNLIKEEKEVKVNLAHQYPEKL